MSDLRKGLEKLAPCPFCGGEGVQEYEYFGCIVCQIWFDSAEKWNRRALLAAEGPGFYAWPCDKCGCAMSAPGYFEGDVLLRCKCGYEKTIKRNAWLNDYRLVALPVEGERNGN